MALIKLIHICCALLSISGFIARLGGQLCNAAWVRHKRVKILPHVNDTILLLAGMTMAIQYRINPLHSDWLLIKILFLLVYIVLGMFALKQTTVRAMKLTMGGSAICVFLAMIAMAVIKPQF